MIGNTRDPQHPLAAVESQVYGRLISDLERLQSLEARIVALITAQSLIGEAFRDIFTYAANKITALVDQLPNEAEGILGETLEKLSGFLLDEFRDVQQGLSLRNEPPTGEGPK